MTRPRPILLLVLAATCGPADPPTPVLSSVDPGAVSNSTSSPTPLTVRGANFFAIVAANFDAPTQSQVNAGFSLEVIHPDGRRFALTGVTLVSEVAIAAVLPAGLSAQTYDLFLLDPRGRTALLPGALQIFQGDCTNNGSPCSTGNPCTTGDTCQGHKCQPGTPLPNGTPCQLTCVSGETCQAGVCTRPPGGC